MYYIELVNRMMTAGARDIRGQRQLDSILGSLRAHGASLAECSGLAIVDH